MDTFITHPQPHLLLSKELVEDKLDLLKTHVQLLLHKARRSFYKMQKQNKPDCKVLSVGQPRCTTFYFPVWWNIGWLLLHSIHIGKLMIHGRDVFNFFFFFNCPTLTKHVKLDNMMLVEMQWWYDITTQWTVSLLDTFFFSFFLMIWQLYLKLSSQCSFLVTEKPGKASGCMQGRNDECFLKCWPVELFCGAAKMRNVERAITKSQCWGWWEMLLSALNCVF